MRALQDAQSDLDQVEVEGTSGGGAVRVLANAVPELRRVEVSQEALEDAELLGDLIVAAVNDALRKAIQAANERLGGLTGALPGLPGLGGLFPDDDDDEDWEDDDDDRDADGDKDG